MVRPPRATALICPIALGLISSSALAQTVEAPAPSQVATPGSLDAGFLANAGQWDPRARFLARQGDLQAWFTDSGLRLSLPAEQRGSHTLGLTFQGAGGELVGRDARPGVINYYSKGAAITGVETFEGLLYDELYPGVDLQVRRSDGQLEYDLLLEAGATLRDVAVRVEGAEGLRLDEEGALVIETSAGPVRQHIPKAWQVEADGSQTALEGRFLILGEQHYGFEFEGRDASRPALLDPILSFSTYIGGSLCDSACDVDVDDFENLYIVGFTESADFPGTVGPALAVGAPDRDAYVMKLNPSGEFLVWTTLLRGAALDEACTVDANGGGAKIWIGGRTQSADFPVTAGAVQTTPGGGQDGWVARLDALGTIAWVSLLGGSEDDAVDNLRVGALNDVNVVGWTDSDDFPVTAGSVQDSDPALGRDGFFTRINVDGDVQKFGSYLGGSGDDRLTGVDLAPGDGGDDLMVSGCTRSDDLPGISPDAFQATRGGGDDGFVIRVNQDGASLTRGTYLGGSEDDCLEGLRTLVTGQPFVAGWTDSVDAPTSPGAWAKNSFGGRDGYASRLNTDLGGVVYATYFGGSDDDEFVDVDTDNDGIAFLVGSTRSSDVITLGNAANGPLGGQDKLFVELTTFGDSVNFSSYFGGPGDDFGRGVGRSRLSGVAGAVGEARDGVLVAPPSVIGPVYGGGDCDGFIFSLRPLPCPTQAFNISMTAGDPSLCGNAVLDISPLVQGQIATFQVSGGGVPNAPAIMFTSLAGSLPITIEFFCTAYLDPFSLELFPITMDATGDFFQEVPITFNEPRCDLKVVFQCLIIDPVGGPLTIGQLSNALECTFGS